jgi:hypothetical protein
MSVLYKIPRGLQVLIVMAILGVLVAKFAVDTSYYYLSIGLAVLITVGIILALYRVPGVAAGKAREKKKKAAEDVPGDSAKNPEAADLNMESGPQSAGTKALATPDPRPDASEIVVKYLKMSGQTPGQERTIPDEPVDTEKTAGGPDGTGLEEPPRPLIEDETSLTEEDKNLLLNAVWYRCENPYCKYSRFLGVHHIIEEKAGGRNRLENLIVLCPYCHDLAHRNEIPEKEMRDWISNREERFKFKPEWPYS